MLRSIGGRFHKRFCALRPSFAPVKSFSKVGRMAWKLGVGAQNFLWNWPQITYLYYDSMVCIKNCRISSIWTGLNDNSWLGSVLKCVKNLQPLFGVYWGIFCCTSIATCFLQILIQQNFAKKSREIQRKLILPTNKVRKILGIRIWFLNFGDCDPIKNS